MPVVEQLDLSPVKSFRSVEDVDEINVDSDGLFGDRQYMLVEGAEHIYKNYKKGKLAGPGHFLSQREDPILTSIVPYVGVHGLYLSSEGHGNIHVPPVEDEAETRIPVSVWGWQGEGIDQGEDAADWASEIVGRQVRLVAASREMPRYVEDNPDLGRVGFSDGFPFTVASVESFKLLNEQLIRQGNYPIPSNRTRTTLILTGLEPPLVGLPEVIFPEDYINNITISSNGLALVLKKFKACGRCPIPDTDQVTGERKGRPVLTALSQLGRHGLHVDRLKYGEDPEIFFSQNFIMELPEDMEPHEVITIAKGAEVSVSYKPTTNWEVK